MDYNGIARDPVQTSAMHELNYENFPPHPDHRYPGKFAFFAGTILGGIAHLFFAALTSDKLFAMAGGVKTFGRMTVFGDIDWAWTNVMWLPGGLLIAIGDSNPTQPTPLGQTGLLLVLAGSLVAGYLLANSARASLRHPRSYGCYRWQLWAVALAWIGWLPVPVKMTLTYQYTVGY